MIIDPDVQARYDAMIESYNKRVEKYNGMSLSERRSEEGRDLANRLGQERKGLDMFWKANSIGAKGYRRLAGEVEARNVEKRANMTMAERLASLAEETEDVAREDQIILREGVAMAMAGKKRGATKSNTSKLGQPTTANGNPPVAYLGTKLNKNYESAIADIENKIKAKGVLSGHEFLHELDNALTGLNEASTDGSDYVDIGDGFTIRVSDHYSNANTFKRFNNTKKNFGIVIKLKNRKFKSDPNVDYVEVVYYPDKLDGNRQLSILDGVKKLVKTKDIGEMPAPDDTHTSEDIRHSLITPELDAPYLDAVERGMRDTGLFSQFILAEAGFFAPFFDVFAHDAHSLTSRGIIGITIIMIAKKYR